jgi:hypothetical protein
MKFRVLGSVTKEHHACHEEQALAGIRRRCVIGQRTIQRRQSLSGTPNPRSICLIRFSRTATKLKTPSSRPAPAPEHPCDLGAIGGLLHAGPSTEEVSPMKSGPVARAHRRYRSATVMRFPRRLRRRAFDPPLARRGRRRCSMSSRSIRRRVRGSARKMRQSQGRVRFRPRTARRG